MKDFFISYNRHDKQWAEWIAWTLEEAGYTVVIQAWDFRPGGNFVLDMQRAAAECEKTIAVLSANYLQSEYTQSEWSAAFAGDPQSLKRKLIPMRVGECRPEGVLKTIVYVDLVGVTVDEAKDLVLGALKERAKPAQEPSFPGAVIPKAERIEPEPVEFPGAVDSPEDNDSLAEHIQGEPFVLSSQTFLPDENWDVSSPVSTVTWQTLLEISNQGQKNQIARSLNELGHQFYMSGDFRSAVLHLERAIQFNPTLASAHFNLGSAYEKLNDQERARFHYEEAAKGDGRASHAAINNLVRLQILQGEADLAINLLLSCLERTKDTVVQWAFHKNLGWAYLLQEQYTEAERHLQAAIELDSQRPEAYCLLAQVRQAQGKKQESVDLWKRCLEYTVENEQAAKPSWSFPELGVWQAEAQKRLKNNLDQSNNNG